MIQFPDKKEELKIKVKRRQFDIISQTEKKTNFFSFYNTTIIMLLRKVQIKEKAFIINYQGNQFFRNPN